MPDPILVGRDSSKLEKLCQQSGVKKMTTNLDEVMSGSDYEVYFDAQITGERAVAVKKAIAAGSMFIAKSPWL